VGVEPAAVLAEDMEKEEFGGEGVGGDVGSRRRWMPCFRAVRMSRDWACGKGIGIDLRKEF